jgi:hypothetical protein
MKETTFGNGHLKQMVTKTVEKWMNIYPTGEGPAWESKEGADMYAKDNRIACVKLTGSYEVEE